MSSGWANKPERAMDEAEIGVAGVLKASRRALVEWEVKMGEGKGCAGEGEMVWKRAEHVQAGKAGRLRRAAARNDVGMRTMLRGWFWPE